MAARNHNPALKAVYQRLVHNGKKPLLAITALMRKLITIINARIRCLIPAFDGAFFSQEWRDALWARFCTGAPGRQRRSVERYNIVKRA
jgi:hypothetical protein